MEQLTIRSIILTFYLFNVILNFYVFTNFIYMFAIINSLTNICNYKLNENTCLINLSSKLILDEFYFGLIYYLWSNFYYMIFLLILVFTPLILYKTHLIFKIIFLFANLIYFFKILDYFDLFFLNNYTFDEQYYLKNYNNLLNNKINKIHPVLLYSSIFSFSFCILNNSHKTNQLHDINFGVKKTYYFLITYFVYTTSVILGGWWALQEGSWGGWWDWDISEIFGFFIIIGFIFLLHNKFIYFNLRSNSFSTSKYALWLIVYYLIMRLNFAFTSHDFNMSLTSNLSWTILYLFLVFVLVMIHIIVKRNLRMLYRYSLARLLFNFKSRNLKLISTFLIFTPLYIVFTSIFPAFGNWFWRNFNFSSYFATINYVNLINPLLPIFISYFWIYKTRLFLLVIVYCILYSKCELINVLLTCSIFSNFFQIHYFYFLLLVLNFTYMRSEFSFGDWINYGYNHNLFYFYNILKTNDPFINFSKNFFKTNYTKHENYTQWSNFSILDFKIFELIYDVYTITQIFIYDSLFNSFFMSIDYSIESAILFLIFITFLFLKFKKTSNQIIVF